MPRPEVSIEMRNRMRRLARGIDPAVDGSFEAELKVLLDELQEQRTMKFSEAFEEQESGTVPGMSPSTPKRPGQRGDTGMF